MYVSRDVVFDESVFPFATLHPNAVARLCAELALLPNVLLNPSASFGDTSLHDQTVVNSLHTNATHSALVVADVTGTNSSSSGEEMGERRHYFMCDLMMIHLPRLRQESRFCRDRLPDPRQRRLPLPCWGMIFYAYFASARGVGQWCSRCGAQADPNKEGRLPRWIHLDLVRLEILWQRMLLPPQEFNIALLPDFSKVYANQKYKLMAQFAGVCLVHLLQRNLLQLLRHLEMKNWCQT